MRSAWAVAIVWGFAVAGCGAEPEDLMGPDAEGAEVSVDDAPDAPLEERGDATGDDVTSDAAVDARDASPDAGRDAVVRDGTIDGAADRTSVDSGRDAVVRDGTIDAPRADAGIDRAPVDGGCPAEMTLVEGRVCVDRWEASLEVVGLDGGVEPWSPYQSPGTRRVRAVSEAGAMPQGYIGGDQAQAACRVAGKRLCALDEWLSACRGPSLRTYPYGNTYVPRRCNEGRTPHPVTQFFGTAVGVFTYENMNNPGINMQANTVAPAGMFWDCVSQWGAYDMVGNLHEWIADPAGTFKGGFYVDAEINGHGCSYTTTAHAFTYHDYSNGFRCCADPRP